MSENRKGLVLIFFTLIASNLIVNYSFAFYPIYIEDNYPEISSFETGIFLSVPDLAITALGIPIGELVTKIGRKKAIRISTFTVLVSSTILACLTLIKHDKDVFFWSSIIFRFIFGLGYIGVFVNAFGTIASDYGKNAGKYNGYGEGLASFGLFLGPIIGSVFFQYLGFFEGYAFLSAVYFVCFILAFFFYPKVR